MRRKTLKDGQKGLERDQKAFKAKQDEEGDLDVRIETKKKALDDYKKNESAYKKAIRKQVEKDFEEKVQADQEAYLNQVNLEYRQRLDREKEELVKQKKAFRDQIKAFVTTFKRAYIQAGVQSSADPSVASEWAEAYLRSKTPEDRDKAESHVFGRSSYSKD